MDTPDLGNIDDMYQKIVEASVYIIDKIWPDSNPEQAVPGRELWHSALREFPGVFDEKKEGTFYAYLSRAAKDTNTRLACPGRKQGYYLLDDAVFQATQDGDALGDNIYAAKNLDEEEQAKRRKREALLYPVLENWLIAQGYQAADVSSNRGLGKWGNPDVAGFSALDAFNGLSLEVVTIEAKPSIDGWEQWIFEAVSHRRFANRAYFAFAYPEQAIEKIPKEMRYYAEIYGIGILAVELGSDEFSKLKAGTLEHLNLDDVEVKELYSAPFNFVQPKFQLIFCEANGIKCLKSLYKWGRES